MGTSTGIPQEEPHGGHDTPTRRRRLLTAGVAVAVAVAAPVVVATTADAATTQVTIAGPSSAYQGVSTKLTVTWKVGGKGHAGTVTVQQRVNGTWYLLGKVTTSSSGTGTVSVKPHATAVFRAVTSTGAVSASKTLTIKAPYAVSLKASPTSVAKGKTSTLTATYTHLGKAVKSASVAFQRKTSSSWTTVKTVKTGSTGKATLGVKPTSSTTYRAVVSGKATSGSTKVTIKSTVPASFTAHGSGYGHGVGMPQYGAYEQALEGRSAATILSTYYKGTSTGSVTTPSTIGVQVWGPEPYGYAAGKYSDTATSTTVHVDKGTWRLRSSAGKTLYEGAAPVTVTLKAKGSTITASFPVTSGGKTVTKSYSDSVLRIHWSGTRYYKSTSTKAVATVKGAQGTYRNGRFTVRSIGGHPNVVNDVLLNTEYLYGIAEVPSSWGLKGKAALSAQAIVARSYALTKASKTNAKCACNVVDDVRDQNFTGWKKQNETVGSTNYGKLWVAAVDATVTSSTKARVLTYKGKAVVAHYYSSSGGKTASSQDVWSATLAYEQSVSDPWSKKAPGNSYASWTRTVSQASAKKIFGLPDVVKISVSKKYSSGQMAKLTATSSSGKTATISGKADALRAKFGFPGAWVSSFTS